MEAKLQSDIIKFLKSKHAYVIKTHPGMGTPTGCPDIIFLYEGAWGVIEVKADAKSKYQPGQYDTLERLSKWSPFVFTVHPNNWHYTQEELLQTFF